MDDRTSLLCRAGIDCFLVLLSLALAIVLAVQGKPVEALPLAVMAALVGAMSIRDLSARASLMTSESRRSPGSRRDRGAS